MQTAGVTSHSAERKIFALLAPQLRYNLLYINKFLMYGNQESECSNTEPSTVNTAVISKVK
jgi:hypothetical protein